MYRQLSMCGYAIVAAALFAVPATADNPHTVAAPASADSSRTCNALFSKLRTAAALGGRTFVEALWSTHYYVPERNERFLGQTKLQLLQNGDDLFAVGNRW